MTETTPLIQPGAQLERLYTGMAWAEGPVWLPDAGAVRCSDIPNDRILQFDAATGRVDVYRAGVEFTNGRTLDLEGRVVQCSHGLRRIERDVDGVVTPIVDRWDGVRFNSPNDVVVTSDGAIWFTDPPYGILSDHEGHAAAPEYEGCFVFRFDERMGELRPVITDMVHPNGLAFSPDETVLYVSDTAGATQPGVPRHIRRYRVRDGACDQGETFALIGDGVCDGLRVDARGRVWASSATGVVVFDAEGVRVGAIPVPEIVSNVCFGGEDGTTLYITASTSLYRIHINL
ncbi:SMP-30/gluconolactonase/LRE family protein [Microbacterium trichothecenolyticum]|uniref:Gluconolactonase n=1 Tax=Microbacterium trichothecenolyticum TaxID=69370 RepID=A0A0M2HFK5_MICTR|nr:SMP-30/gluconolactonase/LRE family protein [Microbacterium trichothecenolyticum]KJL45446.1 Gluconolactonase precursor [Microbacterium trichothecenolyticum]